MTKIDFEKIWTDQLKFEMNFFDPEKMNEEERHRFTAQLALCLHSEVDELLKNVKWKHHREENVRVIESNILEEIIDIFKFWASLAQLWRFTPQDVEKEYWRKTAVVNQRYSQEKVLKLDEKSKIVVLDIDGVLSNYPECFVDFANISLNASFKDLFELKKEVDNKKVEELKHDYRSCGIKASIPAKKGAAEFTRKLKDAGYTIILASARPYKTYNRIFSDTLVWLKNNNIAYDSIVWSENKHIEVIRNFPKMQFMLEDNAQYANETGSYHYKVYLLNTNYNKYDKLNENVKRIDSFDEILEAEGIQAKRKEKGKDEETSENGKLRADDINGNEGERRD